MPNRRQFVTGTAAALGLASLPRSEASASPAALTTVTGHGGPGTATPATSTNLTKFRDPIRIPPVLRPTAANSSLTIRQQATTVRFHSELPLTPVWAYEGSVPGPTIDVRRGQRIRVAWQNQITGAFPVTAITVPFTDLNSLLAPGRGSAVPDPGVAALPAWNVTHLHGGVANGGADGWPENAVFPGDVQLSEYPNDQRATALWYHDHANGITAFNVYAGLAGNYWIRDPEEDGLHLPSGNREIPLTITDRNIDTDAQGVPNGRLLHRIGYIDNADPTLPRLNLPFIGPYNVVNGVIWPYVPVDARWWRFRVLNAANTRPYTLELRVENADGTLSPVTGALVQIGSDQGLLPHPVTHDALVIGTAERADILINFANYAGKRLQLVNTDVNGPSPLGGEVLQFRVGPSPATDSFTLPTTLASSFVRLSPANIPAAHKERWVAFATNDGTALGHPEIWELTENEVGYQPQEGDRLVEYTGQDGILRSFRRTASTFDDGVGFFVEKDGWEVWNFIHLVGPGHPAHIHLVGFQAQTRQLLDVSSATYTGPDRVTWTAGYDGPGVLGQEEQGWKDTIRIELQQFVSVAGQFTGGTGRYVYHCHILEHEDEGMMRPFVVAPKAIIDRMEQHSSHHH